MKAIELRIAVLLRVKISVSKWVLIFWCFDLGLWIAVCWPFGKVWPSPKTLTSICIESSVSDVFNLNFALYMTVEVFVDNSMSAANVEIIGALPAIIWYENMCIFVVFCPG